MPDERWDLLKSLPPWLSWTICCCHVKMLRVGPTLIDATNYIFPQIILTPDFLSLSTVLPTLHSSKLPLSIASIGGSI